MDRQTVWMFAMLGMLAACGDEPSGGNENELITTVVLTFSPSGGAAVVAEFDDPDGDGGNPPMIDPVNLTDGITYTLAVDFQNRLETPAEVITDEVRDEAAEHQIFFTGSAVNGPATDNTTGPLTHVYNDMDANALPIGLTNLMTAATGTGQLTVTLRHLPELNGAATKTADTTAQVKNGGFDAIGGSSDASVTFAVVVP